MGWFSWLPGMSEKKEEKPPEPLVLGATLSCIYGSQASYLDLNTKGFDINGLPEACVEDCVVNKNITPFGRCHVGDMCEYQIAIDGIWQNPEPQKVLKNGKEIITTKSILKCKEASEPFTIKNSGQDGVHAKDIFLIHYMEEKHKDLYKILQDQYGSLYLQGNYEEAIEFLEERLVDNNGEMEIINMYAPDNTEGKLVLATLEKLLVDCKTKAFEDFMEALEHTATENEMTNFSGWDKNYLNLTMIELIKQDCKKTAERIENDPAYRAMEKHKVFSSWGAESMNTIAYTTVLTASAMAGMNTGKGNTSQKSSDSKSTTQKSTDPKSTTQKSTTPAKVKDSKSVSTEGAGQAKSPMFGDDWNTYFGEKYGQGNVAWKPNTLNDVIQNPQRLYGATQSEVANMLGDGWTAGAYGSSKTGWKFTNGDGMVFYHAGGGVHSGSYYGFSSGATGKVKIVGSDYIPLVGDKATVIYYNGGN